MPKCVVVDPNFDWHGEPSRNPVPWDRTVIYEAHVRGFTKLHPDVPEKLRGTYAGLGAQGRDRLHQGSLGVTSVELLPVHTFINDSYLLDKKLVNYWGYNTHRLFRARSALCRPSASRRCASSRRWWRASTTPASKSSWTWSTTTPPRATSAVPTLSFKGIDNASYYRLLPDQPRYYINDTGTGNTVNLSHPRVIQMVTDSLRYWVNECHVDGFRFDLGTILAREPNGFDNQSGFLKACCQDPVLADGEADRRAVGLRAGRLSGGRLSARLGGVERQVPRHGAGFLEGRCAAGGAGAAAVRVGRHVQPPGAPAVGLRELRHRA